MMAALQNFRNMTVEKKMLILGDMRELGTESAAEHRKIVDFLQECSFEKVLLVGEQFTATHPPYHTYANAQEVIKELQTEKPKDYTILIKGSNGIKLNTVVEFYKSLLLLNIRGRTIKYPIRLANIAPVVLAAKSIQSPPR